jgi:biotin carboxyl carrier protein
MPTDSNSVTKQTQVKIFDETVSLELSATDVTFCSPSSWIVRTGASVTEVHVSASGLSDGTALDGIALKLETERERVLRERFGGTAATGRAEHASSHIIKAPMPGMVRAVSVAVGDTVTKNATLLVLEAMKMENNINASVGGRIERIYVEPGKSVEKNMSLIEINTATS